ncbi:hypothetical protein CANCADRAFT_115991 [Tortispora caseinolytica NRRL Y-17796]|uniref:TECPR1-like DysF domain-containing protein n=1 Tax=Tortispora caseinolytica NRRL Y-17796 TaxID=767744 RepID=A0A1E4TH26_9ASCO|nr:hypothetical protein CANCADRAFT_115991 [Tortispora caseinolytica NRRL Y-17796]
MIELENRVVEESSSEKQEEYEIIIENQRGAFLLGTGIFSDGLLYAWDPKAWCNEAGEEVGAGLSEAQVPNGKWEWEWSTWYIDMIGDVDDQGWMYNVGFYRTGWHGEYKAFRSFVRRRRWVRKRVLKRARENNETKTNKEVTFSDENIYTEEYVADDVDENTVFDLLRQCNIDRTKLNLIKKFLTTSERRDWLKENVNKVESLLIFNKSKEELKTMIL